MPQIFRPRANELVSIILCGLLVVVVGAAVIGWKLSDSPYVSSVGFTPEQPVPFSHKHHAGGLVAPEAKVRVAASVRTLVPTRHGVSGGGSRHDDD